MITVVILLSSLSVLLFARAFYIVRADKNLRAKLANMTREERSIYNNQKLAELAAIKAYTDREKTARILSLAPWHRRTVYPGDVDYDRRFYLCSKLFTLLMAISAYAFNA